MAKAKATKKRKVNTEWQIDPAIPDRPENVDLARKSQSDALLVTMEKWQNKHQKRRPKVPHKQEPYRYHANLLRFVETMDRSPLSHREHMVLSEPDGTLYLLHTKRIYCVGSTLIPRIIEIRNLDKDETPIGILLTTCDVRNKQNEDFASVILINGDEGAEELNSMTGIDECGFPTISFACLHRFYAKQKMQTVVKKLTDNELRVVDYSPDERRPLTARQKASLKAVKLKNYQVKKSKLKPPEFGFSLVGGAKWFEEWHRSGYVLLEDTKQAGATLGTGMMHLLLGQDEGTYFGCELSCACSSIEEALRTLIPKELQGRNDLIRQGEWFLVPVDESEVPSEKDAILITDSDNNGWYEGDVWLPLADPDSKKHLIHGYVRVSRDGKVYVKHCVLEHEDHEQADGGNQWITFQKNTAVRSFSQEGVD